MEPISIALIKNFPEWALKETPNTKYIRITWGIDFTNYFRESSKAEEFVAMLKEYLPEDAQLIIQGSSPVFNPSVNPSTGSAIEFVSQNEEWDKRSEVEAIEIFKYFNNTDFE
jgi:hypothetical protein